MTEPRKRGRPRALSEAVVFDAARSMANATGMESVSFRALGQVLAVAPDTVKRAVGSLDRLRFLLMVDAVDEGSARLSCPGDWESTVRAFAHTAADVLQSQPLVLEFHTRHSPLRSDRGDALMYRVVSVLEEAGLDPATATYAFFVVYDFVVGHVSVKLGRGDSVEGRPDSHPVVAARIGVHDYGTRFELGLDIVVAGIAALRDRA
jgi:hypothetical protein